MAGPKDSSPGVQEPEKNLHLAGVGYLVYRYLYECQEVKAYKIQTHGRGSQWDPILGGFRCTTQFGVDFSGDWWMFTGITAWPYSSQAFEPKSPSAACICAQSLLPRKSAKSVRPSVQRANTLSQWGQGPKRDHT